MNPGSNLPPLREVIARFGLTADKRLGQNFLLDLNLTAKIARACPDLDKSTIVEIGPGPGGLTRALLDSGARQVIAIERDRRFLPALAEIADHYPGRLRILAEDALAVDVAKLGPPPCAIIANLPYNVATPLLIRWLALGPALSKLVLMFQKEVADRLLARPKTKDYGRLSILAQWRAEIERLFDLPPRVFTPPPKVSSTVLRLTPRARPAYPADPAILEIVVAAAFGQRRKMLRQSLRRLVPEIEAFLAPLGIPGTARAEELSVEQFCALARAYAGTRVPGPTDRRASP